MSTLATAAAAAASSTSLAAIAAAAAGTETSSQPEAAPPAPAATVPAATPPAAPTVDAAAIRAEARAAERDRIKAIISHPEAEGRMALAQHLAFSTDLAPDAAGSILATSAKDQSPRTLTGATVPQPAVKPQASDPAPGDAKAEAKSRLAAARMAVTGQKA